MKLIRCRDAVVLLSGVLSVGAVQAQAVSAQEGAKAESPIPSVQDWSSRSVIYAAAMTPDEFEPAARSAETQSPYRDPRYVASVLRRIEAEAPTSSQRGGPAPASMAMYATKSSAKCDDRRRGQCQDEPAPGGSTQSVLRDWSNVLGGGADGQGGRAAPGVFPAKYNFDIFAAPSCTADFIAYTTNAAGASQTGSAQEQWSGAFNAQPTNGQTITIGLAGARQRILVASTGSNTGLNFQIGASTSITAQNLRDAINRWAGQTGFRAEGTTTTVTVVSNTAGDINDASVSESLAAGNFQLARTYIGTASAGQPTILAFNQLYNTTCNLGRANTNAPNVMWAYNTGTGYITETSPALSYLDNGKQVAFVQRNGDTLQLVLLKWQLSQGTAANPVAPTLSASAAAYRACTANCYYVIPFSTAAGANNVGGTPTYSSPFVDYVNDILWVGDGNGVLHKFADVFQKPNPREIIGNGFPKVVEAGMKLSSPVFDYNGRVFVGTESGTGTTGGKLHRILASDGTTEATSAKLALDSTTGLRESPIIDLRSGSVYAYVFNDNTTNYTDTAHCEAFNNEIDGCRAIFRFDRLFAGGTSGTRQWIGRGNSTTRTLYAGGFDDAFYNSANGTGSLYITGGRPDNTFYATLWKVPITAGAIGSPLRGPQIGVRDRYTDGAAGTGDGGSNNNLQNLSPVTVIKNPSTGFEYLYASTASWGNAAGCGDGTYAGGACLYMYRLNQLVAGTPGSSETWTFDISRNGNNGFEVNGNFVITTTTLTSPTNFSITGDRTADRLALVAAINAVSGTTGYTAATSGGCGNTGGTTCIFVVTRTAFGNVAASNVTSTLDYRNTSNANGADAIAGGIAPITWNTAVTASAGLAVNPGNGAAPATQVPGGTGGIVIDNVRPTAETGTSQVYFTQGGTTGNAIQASQSGLQ